MLGRKKVEPENPQPQAPRVMPAPASPSASPPARPQPPARAEAPARSQMHIGKSVHIKGELTASEEMTIDGMVDGRIVVESNLLTIGAHGRITAEVRAKSLVVHGKITGNIQAEDKVEVRQGGMVDGDIRAPRVILSDGSQFKGNIDMGAQGAPGTGPATDKRRAAPWPAGADKDAGQASAQPNVDDFVAPFDAGGDAVANATSDKSKLPSLY